MRAENETETKISSGFIIVVVGVVVVDVVATGHTAIRSRGIKATATDNRVAARSFIGISLSKTV